MKKTLNNLAKAFVGESQARNRYTLYAKIAKKEGYEQIAELFLETADHEREHAKWIMRMINDLLGKKESEFKRGDDLKIQADVPTVLAGTAENLMAAINGESYENKTMYPEFAKTAQEEGLEEVSERLTAIGKAEEHHEARYKKLLTQVENKSVFEKEQEQDWVCRKCGYIHTGFKAPVECPSCSHPKEYYQLLCEKY
ncbi:MAG: rubrerythrin family protein [Candidatus Moranbacteria bacterium]|nr:rubrerythrin family protein [Candidatus Moranbacteria bacterium]